MSYFSCVSAIALVMCSCAVQSQDLSVMTYNIRFDNPGDSLDRWDMRKAGVVDFIQQTQPVVLGTQEGQHHQITYMDDNLSTYTYVGVGRDRGDETGESCALFYDSTVVRLVTSGTFWLSETADTGSVGWDAAFPRICTYAKFTADQGEFYVYNVHFDHVGKVARQQSAKQIVDSINAQSSLELPVALIGDFNASPESQEFRLLDNAITCGWKQKEKFPKGPTGTFTGFDTSKDPVRRIDHIFVRGFSVRDYRHLDPRTASGRGLSDHLPVVADLKFE